MGFCSTERLPKYKKNLTEGIHTQKGVRGIVEGRLKKEAEKRKKE